VNNSYNYVNGVCGSGKTYTAIKNIAARVQAGETILYTTETIKLLKQTRDGLEALGIDCHLITSQEKVDWKSHYYSVINDIKQVADSSSSLQDEVKAIHKNHNANFNKLSLLEYGNWKKQFKSVAIDVISSITLNAERPCVILCTTKSLIRASSSIPNNIKLPLYIDEGFVVAESGEFISATAPEIKGIEAKLKLIDEAPEEYSVNNKYQLPEKLELLEQYIANDLYEIQYETSNAKLNWVASLKVIDLVNHFSEITLLAACYEDTLQYHAIKASGCNQKALDWGLENKHYTNGTVHVYWILQEMEWRTTFKNKLSDQQIENIGIAFEGSHWSNEALSLKGIAGVGKLLPVKSHGFNDAAKNHHFLNLHTQMPANYFKAFLKETYKMTDKQIRQAYYQYDCYQAAMRVSLRNSTKEKPRTDDNHFCFGDKATAQYFISKLADSVKIEQSKLIIYRKDEETKSSIIEELEIKQERSDKVSDNKQEQKNRSNDKKRLLKLKPDFADIKGAQNYLRDLRREGKITRVAKAQLDEAIKSYG
jgi:hypothetical protein